MNSNAGGEADPHGEMVEMLRRRHEIYSGLLGKEVALLGGSPPGCTDCASFISVPFEDEHADLIHKHEWQHWFFQTDLRVRAQFVTNYADRLLYSIPATSRSAFREPLETFLHLYINALDDIRVNSLWSTIYPQSAEDLENRWRSIILSSSRYKTDITFYSMGLGLGIKAEMGKTQWEEWDHVLVPNIENVKGKSFAVALISVRIILDAIMQSVLDLLAPPPPPPLQPEFEENQAPAPTQSASRRLSKSAPMRRRTAPTQQQAQQELHEQSEQVLDNLIDGATKRHTSRTGDFMDTPRRLMTPDPSPQTTASTVQAALGASTPGQIDRVLRQAQVDIDRMLATLRNAKNLTISHDQRVLKGLEGSVVFRDVLPEHVESLQLSAEDERLVARMRTKFARLLDRRLRTLSDTGSALDTKAYVDMMLGGDADIFEEDVSTRGFHAKILLDMSGSMLGSWKAVNRAAKVLGTSMSFPFTTIEVWGFSGGGNGGHGVANVFRFKSATKGFYGTNGPFTHAWGLTPLHLATEVAIRDLSFCRGPAQHLFIISDGEPTHISRGARRAATTTDLMTQVALSIKAGRRRRVNCVGLVVGDEIADGPADLMFGGRRSWQRVDREGSALFSALVTLVETAFVGYLRGA